MKIDLFFLEDFTNTINSMPLVFKLSTDRDVRISNKWYVRNIIVSQKGEEKDAVYMTSGLTAREYFYEFKKNSFQYFVIDVSKYMNDSDSDWELPIGKYEISIEVVFYESDENGKYCVHELESCKGFSIDF